MSKSSDLDLQDLDKLAADNPILAGHAAAIHHLAGRVVADVIEIGQRLTDAKRICEHGNFLLWLRREFKWSEKTAENYMRVYALSTKFETVSNLDVPLKALYLLAAPSTPDEARTEIIERAQTGEPVPVAEVKRAIAAAKDCEQPAKRKPAIGQQEVRNYGALCNEIEAKKAKWGIAEDAKRRLEIENVGLRSEVEELKAATSLDTPQGRQHFFDNIERSEFLAAIPKSWGLEARMLRVVSNEKLLGELGRRLPAHLWKKHRSVLTAIGRTLDAPGPTGSTLDLKADDITDSEMTTKH